MIGDLFLMTTATSRHILRVKTFRPHDWGSFFNFEKEYFTNLVNNYALFVPMIGDLFLICHERNDGFST